MRPLRAAGRVPEDDALDAGHSSCSTTPLQTGRIPDRARRTASQLREGSYGRDLGTRPSDDGAGVSSITQNSWKAPMSKPIGGVYIAWRTSTILRLPFRIRFKESSVCCRIVARIERLY